MSLELFFTTMGPIMGLVLGNAAFIIPLFLWTRSESRADIRHMDMKIDAMQHLIMAIKEDMKDFHTRLALQDQEFKMRLCAIEERRKQK